MKRIIGFILATAVIGASAAAAKFITESDLHNQTAIFDDFEQTESVWLYSDKIGSSAASGLERAKVAIGGPLGLSAAEAVYFIAITDEQGQALTSECDYRVTGRAVDARWWSLTLYDRDTQHYVPNTVNRSSFNSETAPVNRDGAWEIDISQTQKGKGWLPAQAKDGQAFELNLRIYNPGEGLRRKIPNIDLPAVERISC